ncbi:MAG: hypothetical protein ACRD59_13715 [Candidatus Acidiferrales bacterium]
MRAIPVLLLCILFFLGLSSQGVSSSQQGSPVRQPDIPVSSPGSWPQQATKRTVDVSQLKAEAQELVALTEALPAQVDKISIGQLPTALIENLKKIEKISKRIRGEIS